MQTPELDLLNQAVSALRKAGINVQVGRMYNCANVDWFIALPENVMKNGHGFELTQGVSKPEEKDG